MAHIEGPLPVKTLEPLKAPRPKNCGAWVSLKLPVEKKEFDDEKNKMSQGLSKRPWGRNLK